MSPGRRRDGEDEPSFADALDAMGDIGDVAPLADRDKHQATPRSGGRPQAPRAPTRFEYPDPEDRGLGIASGIQSSQLRRLRDGRIRPQRKIDLHGLRTVPARRALVEGVADAIQAGERCVLVVHGKGLRSKEQPVLRSALPDWLADPRLERRVLAFAPAQPRDGGRGATYVLLRRSRAQEAHEGSAGDEG